MINSIKGSQSKMSHYICTYRTNGKYDCPSQESRVKNTKNEPFSSGGVVVESALSQEISTRMSTLKTKITNLINNEISILMSKLQNVRTQTTQTSTNDKLKKLDNDWKQMIDAWPQGQAVFATSIISQWDSYFATMSNIHTMFTTFNNYASTPNAQLIPGPQHALIVVEGVRGMVTEPYTSVMSIESAPEVQPVKSKLASEYTPQAIKVMSAIYDIFKDAQSLLDYIRSLPQAPIVLSNIVIDKFDQATKDRLTNLLSTNWSSNTTEDIKGNPIITASVISMNRSPGGTTPLYWRLNTTSPLVIPGTTMPMFTYYTKDFRTEKFRKNIWTNNPSEPKKRKCFKAPKTKSCSTFVPVAVPGTKFSRLQLYEADKAVDKCLGYNDKNKKLYLASPCTGKSTANMYILSPS